MANSSSFFGLRKKSTKSLTFSTWRGMQITKDRVRDISNPQTTSQMEQRIKMPLVAQARTLLRGIVNHSWQGVDYGYKSLYRFSSENLRKGNLNIVQAVPKGLMSLGLADYVVSSGSLQPTLLGSWGEAEGSTDYPYLMTNPSNGYYNGSGWADLYKSPCFSPAGTSATVSETAKLSDDGTKAEVNAPTEAQIFEFWKAFLLNNAEDTQMSFLALIANSNSTWTNTNDNTTWAQPRFRPALWRIDSGMTADDMEKNLISCGFAYTQEAGKDAEYSYDKNNIGNYVYLQFGDSLTLYALMDTVDEETITVGTADGKDIQAIVRKFGPVDHWTNDGGASSDGADDVYYGIASKTELPKCSVLVELPGESGLLGGLAIINSEKNGDSYRRSYARIATYDGDVISYNDVIGTYLASSASSAKFLNLGDDATGITGNSGLTDGDTKIQG